MAVAYAVVLVEAELFDRQRRDTVQMAQGQADEQFRRLAEDARLTQVTRNPEPRVMTVPEFRQQFPKLDPLTLVALYFTADIT